MSVIHLEVLEKNQQELFSEIEKITSDQFYLAGGTALALQIGHRTSVDFDFYSKNHFDSFELSSQIDSQFADKAVKTGEEKDTLFYLINNVDVSFFWYQYPLIDRLTDMKGVKVAGLKDIAAMKMIVVSKRPVIRDYIDIYYLLKYFSLSEMIGFASTKYSAFNLYFTLRALSYFDDITEGKNKRPIKVLDPDFNWDKAKEEIFKRVKEYQLSMLK